MKKICASQKIAVILAIVFASSSCFVTAFAVGDGTEAGTSPVRISFYADPPESVPSPSGPIVRPYVPGTSTSSGGGSNNLSRDADTVTIGDTTVPLSETVSIPDPDVPLAGLGELPKTGGNTLVPMLLLAAGAAVTLLGTRKTSE